MHITHQILVLLGCVGLWGLGWLVFVRTLDRTARVAIGRFCAIVAGVDVLGTLIYSAFAWFTDAKLGTALMDGITVGTAGLTALAIAVLVVGSIVASYQSKSR